MTNLNGKLVAILTEDGFEEVELTSPKEALEKAGAEVHIVSPQAGSVRAKEGDEWTRDYEVDVQLTHASPTKYDALIIPGGVINPDKMRTNSDALAFIKAFSDQRKPIAAICHGPEVLINAEIVEGKKMTSVEAIKIDLIHAGAYWEDSEVVVDEGLITSRTPKDLPAFNEKIIDSLVKH